MRKKKQNLFCNELRALEHPAKFARVRKMTSAEIFPQKIFRGKKIKKNREGRRERDRWRNGMHVTCRSFGDVR